MVVTPLDVLPAAEKHLPLRKMLSVGVGNALEFYDFIAFAFFATQIARNFFPASQASRGLLFTLAFFGLGFFTRPLGAIVIGYYGDTVGRKPAMVVSLALMGISVVGLAFTPSYAQIGIAAPILLLLFRVLQGFALGGEVGPSTAFLIEAAPPHRRGLYASIQQASQGVAILTAGVVTFVLTSLLTAESLQAWGWRVAFLLGAAIVPVGVYIRRQLPETLEQSDSVTAFATTPLESWHVASLGLLILGSMTISTYTLGYMNTFAQESLNLTPELAFGAILINGLAFALAAPLSGMLCDRFGRKPVMLCAVGALLVLVIPCFSILVEMRSVASAVYRDGCAEYRSTNSGCCGPHCSHGDAAEVCSLDWLGDDVCTRHRDLWRLGAIHGQPPRRGNRQFIGAGFLHDSSSRRRRSRDACIPYYASTTALAVSRPRRANSQGVLPRWTFVRRDANHQESAGICH